MDCPKGEAMKVRNIVLITVAKLLDGKSITAEERTATKKWVDEGKAKRMPVPVAAQASLPQEE
jgi:hypothetical protein